MELKRKAIEFRRQLVSGQLPQERPQLALAISWTLNFFLGFIMANAAVLGRCGPFGVAAVAQAGVRIGGLMCTLGASVGYLLTFGFEHGIKYVSASVLVFTVAYVFQESNLSSRRWFMPCAAAFFTLLAGLLGTMDHIAPASLTSLITETIFAGGGAYFFREALTLSERETESAETRHAISVMVLLSCMLIALTRLELGGLLSIGRLGALLIVLTASCKGGALSGAAAGAALGIAVDFAAGGTPYFAAAYAFAGLVSGVFSRHRRVLFVISAVLANAAAVVSAPDTLAHMPALYETFAASVIFLLLPDPWLNFAGAFLRPAQLTSGESGLRRYTAKRLDRMSEAFRDLYDTVDKQFGAEENDEDPSKIFDNASRTVCARCKNKNLCWNQNYMDTLAVFNDLTPVIRNRGLVMKSDVAAHFIDQCLKPEELVSAVNGELRARMYRQRFRSRLAENRSAAYGQYADMSEILKEASEELQNAYGPDMLSQRRLTRYLNSLDIDADISVFRDRSGRLHIIVESTRLRQLTREEGYLDKLSGVVGVRLCRPHAAGEGEGRMVLLEAEPMSVSVGIASMKKKGETVSGDRGVYFKTDGGKLCVILSDGMGSGSEAAKESVSAVRVLERFLRAGVEPEVAMRMLNSMMLLKNGEEWGFATVDLMCVDLFTGETGFYKYGAAPSYIRSGKSVRRVRCESLAAGLTVGEDSQPDVIRMRLKPGCLALIASDGVIGGGDDTWLRTVLSESDGQDTKALARQTLQTALRQYGSGDDMTVLAVRIDNRE